MNWRERCGVVIPCLNEARTIGGIVAGARAWVPTVVVVDDGSTDDSAAAAAQAGAVVRSHPTPRGKGAALATGFHELLARHCEFALTLDGDGQHAPADIPRFLETASASQADLLVGNRMPDAAAMPWVRRQVNRWMSRRLSRLARSELPDSQCGFRLLRLEVWAALELETSHFEVESEMLLAFLAAGARVEFVPIQVIYKSERSKIHPWRDTWRWLAWYRRARQRWPHSQLQERHDSISKSWSLPTSR